ncbi:MAG: hypothetical protein QM783_06185 [Phycisphaerales bacterium]
MGVTQGTVRRIYVPTALGFAARGNRNVPPNADLIFTTQVQWVGEPKPPAAAPANLPPAGKPLPAAGTPAASGGTSVPASEVPEAIRKRAEEGLKTKLQQPPK